MSVVPFFIIMGLVLILIFMALLDQKSSKRQVKKN